MNSNRAWWFLGILAVCASCLHVALTLGPSADGSLLFCPDNTFRDVEVYGLIRRGQLPLQGPSTSVGGAHGYLAYWIFGAWLSLWTSPAALIALDALLIAGALVAMFLVARDVASPAAAWLAIAVVPATNLSVLLYYPNHILLLPVATAVAVLAWRRCPRGGVWPWLLTLALVIAVGSHRIGWLLLAGFLLADLRAERAWLRQPWALLPLAVYLIPEAVTAALGNPEGPLAERSWWMALEERRPLDVLRTLPFLHIDDDPVRATQWIHTVATLGALALSRPRPQGDPAGWRALWWAYLLMFVFFCFWTPDTQYYFPMFALLPAILARAADRVAQSLPAGTHIAGVTLLALALLTALDLRPRLDDWMGSPIACDIGDELPILDALHTLRASDDEVLSGTAFVGEAPGERHLAWLYLAFGPRHPERAPTRCLRVEARDPAQPSPDAIAAGRWEVFAAPGEGCASNLKQHGEGIWFLDLGRGTLYRR